MDVEAHEELSVEGLAAAAGVTTRTIRFYQSEGLLPAPVRRGREARYGPDHLDRLRLITELARRGLRLSAIGELLTTASEASSTADWLGLGEALGRPWSEDRPSLMTDDELGRRLAGSPPGTAERLAEAGLVERRADTTPVVWLVLSPGMLDVALATMRLGVDVATGARLRDLLQRKLAEAATELVAAFTAEVSVGHLADGGPGELARLLDQLRPLTRRTVDLLFAHEMERAQRELLDAAEALSPPLADH
jgi:DNA-binding transcriptional MerR regulator